MHPEKSIKSYWYESILSNQMNDFVTLRRSMGFACTTEAKWLAEFDRYLDRCDHNQCSLPAEIVRDWAKRRVNESDTSLRCRISFIRTFARFLVGNGVSAYIISKEDVPRLRSSSYIPHIFSHHEISKLIAYSNKLAINGGDRSLCFVIKLLYCCGLRIGETLRIKVSDVNLDTGVLSVKGKFQKTRFIPMQPDLVDALRQYIGDTSPGEYLFPKRSDGGIFSCGDYYNFFRMMLHAVGIPFRGRGFGPRVHDLRHTFAVHSLLLWTQRGVSMSTALPRLSEYLGHKNLQATERYLHLAMEAYPEINRRLSEYTGDIIPTGE